jgi:hypothetical protein
VAVEPVAVLRLTLNQVAVAVAVQLLQVGFPLLTTQLLVQVA